MKTACSQDLLLRLTIGKDVAVEHQTLFELTCFDRSGPLLNLAERRGRHTVHTYMVRCPSPLSA